MNRLGPSDETKQRLKALSYQVKLTTRIHGETKTNFMNDCIKRGMLESKVLKEIVNLHYSIIKHYSLEGKEFSDIKKILL